MSRPMSGFAFRAMSLIFKIRDSVSPRKNVLGEVDIRPGSLVLDYGCGPGSYVAATAELVGQTGRVFALDIHPLATQRVQALIRKRKLTNVETIMSDGETGLKERSVDVVLLYDTFHLLDDPEVVLRELHRVLKDDGILSFNDHHMADDEVAHRVTASGLFRLTARDKMTFTFIKVA